MPSDRCQGTTKAGNPCRFSPPLGKDYCWAHDDTPEGIAARELKLANRTKARQRNRETRRSEKVAKQVTNGHYVKPPRSAKYLNFCTSPYPVMLINGETNIAEVARTFGTTRPTISKWMEAIQAEQLIERMADGWEPTEEALQLLQSFPKFRARFFQLDNGKPYLTPLFHQRWVDALLACLEGGTRQLILSPPRHGKTDLLLHFCVWLIVRNPNVKIIWIAKSEDLSKRILDAIRDILETSEELQDMYLPPGGTFKPPRSGSRPWSSREFTVATRTVPGVKSRTMTGIGRGQTLLSMDANIIIVDDVVDFSSEQQPAGRTSTLGWWATTLESRKVDSTALFVIGSRVNPDDLYAHLLENRMWKDTAIVEQAHDPGCLIDPNKPEFHVQCMLFPEINPYSWLMDQFTASEISGGRAIAEMVYQNNPSTFAGNAFTKEQVEKARDTTVHLGTADLSDRFRLIAGLDPAPVNYQAAFLWAYALDPWLLRMIDVETTKAGGVRGAYDIIKQWKEQYGVHEWVIEDNAFQRVIRQDRRIRDYADRHGIVIHGHNTYQNKHDPVYGVTGFSPMFDNGQIILPFADDVAIGKTNLYIKQLLRYDGSRNKKPGTSDILMASWFPMEIIRQRRLVQSQEVQVPDDGWNIDLPFELDDLAGIF